VARLSSGETFRLSDIQGRNPVVLSFYPRDFTPGCTKQLCSYRDGYELFQRHYAILVGISYDNPSSHRRFAKEHELPFHLISDTDRSLSRLYGVARLGGLIPFVRRVTFVIDAYGIIRRIAHHETAIHRHIEEVADTLEMLAGELER
jgi:peroxiredoxin Q/BCP